MMSWKLGSGEVVIDRHQSHIHGEVVRHLPEALARIDARGQIFFVEEVDFGRPIGETICVATSDADEIVYAQRAGRRGLTRFVKNRVPAPTAHVTLVLKQDDRDRRTYVLITAFLGRKAEKEPWDQNIRTADERRRAEDFWAAHALVWGSEPTVPGTETTVCPW
jgi:hypothetical protein